MGLRSKGWYERFRGLGRKEKLFKELILWPQIPTFVRAMPAN